MAARGTGAAPCHRKARRPPSAAARAEAAAITGREADPGAAVASFADWAAAARTLRPAPPAATPEEGKTTP